MTRFVSKYKEMNEVLGAAIRDIRRRRGMSQMELAEKIDVSYQQIQKYEYGKSQVTLARLRQIAEALDVPLKALINSIPEIRSDGEGEALTHTEKKVVDLFRTLRDDKERDRVLKMFEELLLLLNLDNPGTLEEAENGDVLTLKKFVAN
jgi:transcriptional regulator with XRE-family HTH domain